jgi:phosphopantothenoylcysteine decarboxylase/phosphopantothenoylcysteine decarboxylase/phosphopantothenate--cysteine ligase
MKQISLGVTGSVAAYKAADIAGHLTRDAISVQTIMTKAATGFITPLTFQSLTGKPVYTEIIDDTFYPDIRHIQLVRESDALVVAPASANFIGKMASGIADDMLTTVALVALEKKVIIAPAMNTSMYENPIVQRNMKTLQDLGCIFIEPRIGLLACGDYGKGALAKVDDIVRIVEQELGDF